MNAWKTAICLPEFRNVNYSGKLFVLEGADGSGRSTQIRLLSEWLEGEGYAVRHMGLGCSSLMREELEEAKRGNILGHTTLSLFYATDFFDQLINQIIPALRAGYVVLADRYIYTLMARDIVRGADREWVHHLYSPALIPDAVFYFQISAGKLIERNLQKNHGLDYWESGMDLALSHDIFDSFLKYQRMIQNEFRTMSKQYNFENIPVNRQVQTVQADLRKKIGEHLDI